MDEDRINLYIREIFFCDLAPPPTEHIASVEVVVVGLGNSVANDMSPANHFANGKEATGLQANDAVRKRLLRVDCSTHLLQHGLKVHAHSQGGPLFCLRVEMAKGGLELLH